MMANERWTPVSFAMPPAGVPVEVRWEMGDSRVIILGSMMARDIGSGEWLWLNLTTKAPLPHGWHAIEWRPSPSSTPEPAPLESIPPHIEPLIPRRA
jgi:hypothetical protein